MWWSLDGEFSVPYAYYSGRVAPLLPLASPTLCLLVSTCIRLHKLGLNSRVALQNTMSYQCVVAQLFTRVIKIYEREFIVQDKITSHIIILLSKSLTPSFDTIISRFHSGRRWSLHGHILNRVRNRGGGGRTISVHTGLCFQDALKAQTTLTSHQIQHAMYLFSIIMQLIHIQSTMSKHTYTITTSTVNASYSWFTLQ